MLKRISERSWPYRVPFHAVGTGVVVAAGLASVVIGVVDIWFTPPFLAAMLPTTHGMVYGGFLVLSGGTVLVGGLSSTWAVERVGLWASVAAFLIFAAGIFTGLHPALSYVGIICLHGLIGAAVVMRIVFTRAWRTRRAGDPVSPVVSITHDPVPSDVT